MYSAAWFGCAGYAAKQFVVPRFYVVSQMVQQSGI